MWAQALWVKTAAMIGKVFGFEGISKEVVSSIKEVNEESA
jgi:hypothetical protein